MIRKQRLNRRVLQMILGAIFSSREEEIDCDTCLAELDAFTEHTLMGKEPTEAGALVRDHLSRCGECREEYELLLAALQNIES